MWSPLPSQSQHIYQPRKGLPCFRVEWLALSEQIDATPATERAERTPTFESPNALDELIRVVENRPVKRFSDVFRNITCNPGLGEHTLYVEVTPTRRLLPRGLKLFYREKRRIADHVQMRMPSSPIVVVFNL